MFVQPLGLVWAASALLLSAILSFCLELKLTRTLLAAGLRSFLQLFVLGLILSWVFKAERIGITFIVILMMTAVATHTVAQRVVRSPYRGVVVHAFASLILGAWVFSIFAGTFVLTEGSWRKPEVILPFAGLLLGNSVSGLTLGLVQWTRSIRERREWLETQLSLGATRWEAALPLFREAVLTAMTPVLNAMTVAGIVSLPGMLTGQLLAGADPRSAVLYQIAGLFLIATSSFFGTLVVLGLGFRTVLNPRHQLELEM